MKNKSHIQPKTLSIITTYQCTATCEDCCFHCNPLRKERLTVGQVENFVKQVKSVYPSITHAVLTGGECFVLGEDLYKMIDLLHTHDFSIRIVTNAFWANSLTKTKAVIERLQSVGVSELNFSTGDNHQCWVPLDNVVNAVVCAIEAGIHVAVNIETHRDFSFSAKQFYAHKDIERYKDSPLLKVISGQWLKSSDKNDAVPSVGIPVLRNGRCKYLFDTITLSPNNELFSCCGLTLLDHNYLNLGIVGQNDLETIWEGQFDDFIKIWLFAEGPGKILSFAHTQDPTINIGNEREHTCEKCSRILSNPKILKVLRDSYQNVLPRVLIEYHTLLNVLHHLKPTKS